MGVKHFYILFASIVIITFGFFLSFRPFYTQAIIGGLSTSFGGRVLVNIPCPCSGNALLIVGPPKGGSFVLTPFSRIYKNYRPSPPNWVLGLADGLSVCLVGVPPVCVPAGEGPIIRIIGTS